MATEQNIDRSQFLIPNEVPIVPLECKKAFQELTSEEKKYAHYLARASWSGGLICLFQTSPESPVIYLLLQKLFKTEPVGALKEKAVKAGLTENEFQAFLTYAAAFFSNLGNYKSFGDTKFIPDLPKDKLLSLLKASAAYASDPSYLDELISRCGDAILTLSKKTQQLGLGDDGISTYFSGNCTMADAELAKRFMLEKKIDAYNTRLFKSKGADGKFEYEVRLASAQTGAADGDNNLKLGSYDFEGVKVNVTRGDYGPLMKMVSDNLLKAKEYGANEHEVKMLQLYASSFTTGLLQDHMDGSRSWIKDKGPIVEHYIGFIETYRDPFGMRGEWEGFVSIVNKQMSAKFGQLVENAERFLPLLPWPKDYEKDVFLKPDFTSLEVLSYASSGIPAGINIPNYDDIRQSEGFKNVSLGNVLSAHTKDQKITFLKEADKELYSNLKGPSFEVQVGLHELLGHGSGKLFIQDEKQNFNFDIENVKHAETGEKIKSWYLSSDTYDSKFPVIGSSYEECRAECVGLYLCLSRDILKIFGHEGSAAEDIFYINWLNMVRAGLLALEFYTPETRTWRQAHMQARYVILRVLLEAGKGLVTIERDTGEDGRPDATVLLDRQKIETGGKEAIEKFLRKLQVFKSTGDYDSARAMYDGYSAVNDDTAEQFLSLRQVVLSRKLPRRMFVQVNTTTDAEGEIVLQEYEATAAGIVQSFVERFPGTEYEQIVKELWEKDRKHFY
ncbi:dipeptidyl peptidase 3-like [Patiria miniata]|uniref:Dipeptidyl peptidase 3 n=1 Tax=Patiria miniata TaxID=46514 RepID=A0A914B9J6_PATMI|nr:dipeptidyl peptidase 3-like [Patiria miniata]XP_038072848.1 dipeptidyl peptidase 3-like [Patiria miniata]